jgi:hypothetical protein
VSRSLHLGKPSSCTRFQKKPNGGSFVKHRALKGLSIIKFYGSLLSQLHQQLPFIVFFTFLPTMTTWVCDHARYTIKGCDQGIDCSVEYFTVLLIGIFQSQVNIWRSDPIPSSPLPIKTAMSNIQNYLGSHKRMILSYLKDWILVIVFLVIFFAIGNVTLRTASLCHCLGYSSTRRSH